LNHYRRTPRDYDGTRLTTQRVNELLPVVLRKIHKMHQDRPDLILAAWPEIVGAKLAPMTEAVSFQDGILSVKVRNSTLYSLLKLHDRQKLLAKLQKKFPDTEIKNIHFRIG
jgi:predicted nucleic acid-binding Zn ribbon protein